MALLAEKAEVQYNPDETSPETIAEEINGLGFQAEFLPDASSGSGHSITVMVMREGGREKGREGEEEGREGGRVRGRVEREEGREGCRG